jgi:hypothetical protein
MANLKEASNNIKRLAVIFKSLTDLSEMIDQVDSLENHVGELRVAKDALIASNASLEEIKLASVEAVAAAKSQLEVVQAEIVSAQSEYEKQKFDLEQSLVAGALAEKANFEAQAKLLKDELAAQIDDKKLDLAGVVAELEEKSAKLAEVKKALDEIKGGI